MINFNVKAANGQVIGASQMYASEATRETGVASVKANGGTTEVKDNSRRFSKVRSAVAWSGSDVNALTSCETSTYAGVHKL